MVRVVWRCQGMGVRVAVRGHVRMCVFVCVSECMHTFVCVCVLGYGRMCMFISSCKGFFMCVCVWYVRVKVCPYVPMYMSIYIIHLPLCMPVNRSLSTVSSYIWPNSSNTGRKSFSSRFLGICPTNSLTASASFIGMVA